MKYSIKQVAELSNISTRTLRYYDSIDLLKPAFIDDNGYRMYEKEQLLILQHILFYKEFNMPLKEIKHIISMDDFKKITTLKKHKYLLLQEITRMKQLVETIDKTNEHLINNIPMDEFNLYKGFNHPSQIELKEYMTSSLGDLGDRLIDHRKKLDLSKQDILDSEKDADRFFQWALELINNQVAADSEEAQALALFYYKNIFQYYAPEDFSNEDALKLILSEIQHPASKKKFDSFHPDFIEFYSAIMTIFLKK